MPKAIEKMEEVVSGLYKASERSFYILHNGDLKFCIKERLDKLLKIDGTLENVVKNYRARGDAKAAKKTEKTEKVEAKKEPAEKKESANERRNRLRREARKAKKAAGKHEPNPMTIIDNTPTPAAGEPIVVESLPPEGDTEPATTEMAEQSADEPPAPTEAVEHAEG